MSRLRRRDSTPTNVPTDGQGENKESGGGEVLKFGDGDGGRRARRINAHVAERVAVIAVAQGLALADEFRGGVLAPDGRRRPARDRVEVPIDTSDR